jgi:hypothetical protein
MRDAGVVSEIVDPTPIINERLKALAAEHEPSLSELDVAIAEANRGDRRRLKRGRRRKWRFYRLAQRKVQALTHSRAAW